MHRPKSLSKLKKDCFEDIFIFVTEINLHFFIAI
jgi:hypothetical protein